MTTTYTATASINDTPVRFDSMSREAAMAWLTGLMLGVAVVDEEHRPKLIDCGLTSTTVSDITGEVVGHEKRPGE